MPNQTVPNPYSARGPISKLRATSPYTQYSPLAAVVGGLVVCVMYGVLCYSTLFSLPWQADMGFVHGRVDEVTLGSKFNSRVKYSYAVNGEKYTTHQLFKFHGHFLRAGDSVDVRYDRKQPAFAFIQSGFTLATVLYAVGAVLGLICFLAGISESCKKPSN